MCYCICSPFDALQLVAFCATRLIFDLPIWLEFHRDHLHSCDTIWLRSLCRCGMHLLGFCTSLLSLPCGQIVSIPLAELELLAFGPECTSRRHMRVWYQHDLFPQVGASYLMLVGHLLEWMSDVHSLQNLRAVQNF